MFQFSPSGTETPDVTLSWLVDGAAPAEAVDLERMVWLWDVMPPRGGRLPGRDAQYG